jgi:diaminohydroxyphosphoribosylaminopyrimidine deaminase/5-amino-6-(5-phosphoribosylamino)uracil reductase
MQRCLELAKLGTGYVAPNPLVGAVLVYQNRIIGEGWHQLYGKAHAEVNCINSVTEEDKVFISQATLYVSLEPCAHYGKTPPCSDLIIRNRIPKVVVGCTDPFNEVNGKGIDKLRAAGIEVVMADQEIITACENINTRFFTFHKKQRPYVILKWAQTADGFMGYANTSTTGDAGDRAQRLLITNDLTNRLVHQWRSEEAAILVGTNTAMLDDPQLTNRLWPGLSPVRLVLDMSLRLSPGLSLFNGKAATIVFNATKHTIPGDYRIEQLRQEGGTWYYQLGSANTVVRSMLNALYKLDIQSVLVEGGAKLSGSFIAEKCWDEIRTITNESLQVQNGISAPVPGQASLFLEQQLLSDLVRTYHFPKQAH